MKQMDYKAEAKKFKADESGKMNNRKNWLFCYLMIGYLILVWAFFFILNNFESFYLSFISYDYYGNASWNGINNFVEAFRLTFMEENSLLTISFINSIKTFFWTTLMLPVTLMFSYLICRGIPGYRVFRILIMMPNVISGFIMTMVAKQFINGPLVNIFEALGINISTPLNDPEHSFAIILIYQIWTGFASVTIFYSNAMKEIDDSIVESFRMDGVTGVFGEMWHIYIPGAFGTISTFLIGACTGILTAGGPQLAFYMYNAPSYVYTTGYYFTLKVYNATDYSFYPVLAAMGWMITIVVLPFVRTVKHLLDKYGPSED